MERGRHRKGSYRRAHPVARARRPFFCGKVRHWCFMSTHLNTFLLKNELLPEADLQALMNWTDSTLEARRGRGQMPPYLSRGKVRLYRHVDVMEWFESDALLSVYETKSKRITADLLK